MSKRGTKRAYESAAASVIADLKRRAMGKPRGVSKASFGRYVLPGTGVELKYIDTTINGNVGSSANQFSLLLNSMQAGTDDNQRIGRKVTNTSIQLHYRVAGSTTDLGSAQFPENYDTVRVVVVFDKSPNGVAANYNSVFSIPSAGITDPYAFRQLDESDRFIILADNHHSICATGPNGVNNSRYLKCKLPTRYNGTSTGISNIATGAIYLFAVDENTTTSTPVTIVGTARVTLTDD